MKNIILLFIFLPLLTTGQIINTIAGSGGTATAGGGFSGDGGPAIAAKLNAPQGVAVDASGNVYIADYMNNRVRKVDTNGIIRTIAGTGVAGYNGDGGPATLAELNLPMCVVVDAAGNIYIDDENNVRIRKINPAGTITTIAGNGTPGYNGDNIMATAAQLSEAMSMTVDNAGNIYIADSYNQRVRKVDLSGVITTFAGNLPGAGTGTGGFSGDGGPATAAELNWPSSVAIDKHGNVFIADASNNRIRKVDTAGVITTFATATVGYMTIDTIGILYITGVDIVSTVNAAGIVTTIAGNGIGDFTGDGGPAISCELDDPADLAIDKLGNIYIADQANNRIRKISAITGVKSLLNISAVNLYPNPTSKFITISSNDKITAIIITNILGQTVYTNQFNSHEAQINVSELSSGIYFVKVNGSELRKFVKE